MKLQFVMFLLEVQQFLLAHKSAKRGRNSEIDVNLTANWISPIRYAGYIIVIALQLRSALCLCNIRAQDRLCTSRAIIAKLYHSRYTNRCTARAESFSRSRSRFLARARGREKRGKVSGGWGRGKGKFRASKRAYVRVIKMQAEAARARISVIRQPTADAKIMQDGFDFRPIWSRAVCVLTFTRSRVPNKERAYRMARCAHAASMHNREHTPAQPRGARVHLLRKTA